MDQGHVLVLVLDLVHAHDQGQDLGRDQNLVRVQDLIRGQNHGLNPLCLKSRSCQAGGHVREAVVGNVIPLVIGVGMLTAVSGTHPHLIGILIPFPRDIVSHIGKDHGLTVLVVDGIETKIITVIVEEVVAEAEAGNIPLVVVVVPQPVVAASGERTSAIMKGIEIGFGQTVNL